MFYQPKDGHGLPHNPFNALIAPRPIAWISTRGPDGTANLAPYSFFNGVSYVPPQVMFASTSAKPDQDNTKDSVANIRATGVFAVNLVSRALKDAMNITSEHFDRTTDEFDRAGLEKAECSVIDCPRVAASPATLECRLVQIVRLPGEANYVTFGEVVGVHIADDALVDGMVDITRFEMLARLGYRDYTAVTEAFTLARPDD
ncbi:flavin reductase family protein [Pseudaestuariivita atlantica]|uniref:Flavin reductase n=1 Tax=Pseudaestuariivita atlantica TaxID=1317121 RepID=A0A0L1JSU0_9RHOB|nr:flavin reductase family protein [Pseudaestuariivita atlantica]KNG94831.1 flavin reductase [Pseudaestuariivita atlantica]